MRLLSCTVAQGVDSSTYSSYITKVSSYRIDSDHIVVILTSNAAVSAAVSAAVAVDAVAVKKQSNIDS